MPLWKLLEMMDNSLISFNVKKDGEAIRLKRMFHGDQRKLPWNQCLVPWWICRHPNCARAQTGLLVAYVNPTNPTYEVIFVQINRWHLWDSCDHSDRKFTETPHALVAITRRHYHLKDLACLWGNSRIQHVSTDVFAAIRWFFSRCWMDVDGGFNDSTCVHSIGEVLGYSCCRCRDQRLSRSIWMLGLA